MTGYTKPFYLLPFDHRRTFADKLFGTSSPSGEQHRAIAEYKQVIYEGLLSATEKEVPREFSAILADEEYALPVLEDAGQKGITTAVCVEKSGTTEFEFEYGEEFRAHLEKIRPAFAKALLHYNPADTEANTRTLLKLRELSVYCKNAGFGFLLEPLTETAPAERAHAIEQLILEFYRHGVEPDIWKIEGLSSPAEYAQIVSVAQGGDRPGVGVIVLGHGEDMATVDAWLAAGRGVSGIIGFAVGRSVFWEPIALLHENKINREEAVSRIAAAFTHCYRVFIGNEEE